MINWFKYPFIRLLMPFALGIWLSFTCLDLSESEVRFVLMAVIFLCVTLLIIVLTVKDYRYRWIFGVILNLHLLLIGVAVVHIRNDDSDEDADVWMAKIAECPTEKDKTVKVMLKRQSTTCPVLAYFEKTEQSLSLKYGDVIAFFEPPKIVESPKNPEQFDYQRYLSRKGIFRQVYLKNDSWEKLNINRANPIYAFSYRFRDFLLNTMLKMGVTGGEYAVAAAILLGYDDTLPTELRQKYVVAGSMHILCVSGMHVGVVFMVFSYLLFFLDRNKRWQHILKQLLLFLLIWFYALLAGLAPSILRSTIMLSFLIVGDMLKRDGILLNSLAASAFLLLCIDPANLFNIGFLLSYSAVVGIVTLQKPICNLLFVKPKFLSKIWEMTSVTLAAQVATLPFSIYYFHQFPTYFWLSNLFMGPISSVVIIGGILMLIVCFIPYINIGVAFCVKWMIYLMNHIVSWIENLPMSMIKGLYINDMELICLIVSLLFMMIYIEHRQKKHIFCCLSILLIFSISQFGRTMMQQRQRCFTVYSIRKSTAIDFICENEHILFCDTMVFNDPSVSNFNIDNNLIRKGVFSNSQNLILDDTDFDNDFMKKRDNVISFGGKTIGIYDEKSTYGVKMPYRPHLDYFIVQGSNKVDIERLLNVYVIDLLIIDGSIPDYASQKLIKKAEDMGQKVYDVKKEGAFVLCL